MPYTETHSITIPAITLPAGVRISVAVVPGTSGQQAVEITATSATSKDDAVATLQGTFALFMTAASAEGVGQPVFVAQPPAPAPTPIPAPATALTA